MVCQGAQGLQTEQQLAEAVQRAATQQAADMPVILYDEHGQPHIQPYLQMQQHYEARRCPGLHHCIDVRPAFRCSMYVPLNVVVADFAWKTV